MELNSINKFSLQSFELSDKYAAWFQDDDGSFFSLEVHAIGLAKLEIHYINAVQDTVRLIEVGNVLVGLMFTEEGMELCDESSNFVCVLPASKTLSYKAIDDKGKSHERN